MTQQTDSWWHSIFNLYLRYLTYGAFALPWGVLAVVLRLLNLPDTISVVFPVLGAIITIKIVSDRIDKKSTGNTLTTAEIPVAGYVIRQVLGANRTAGEAGTYTLLAAAQNEFARSTQQPTTAIAVNIVLLKAA